MTEKLKRKTIYFLLLPLLAAAAAGYCFCLPRTLFDEPFSATVWSRDGRLMSAKVASDGQWRFFPTDSVPYKFRVAITTYEDKRFYRHFGVDPLALGRAVRQNLASGRVASGASTLTMQTIRLSRGRKARTFREKIVEAVLATRLEFKCGKEEILALYASHAPFGGNVIGLESAAWYYFGRSAGSLSWGESAMLAVLPNSPALIHIRRNRERLRRKRDDLLERIWRGGHIDSLTCALARQEPLPDAPEPMPMQAMHLLGRMRGGSLRSTLDYDLQRRVNELALRHNRRNRGNKINNLAVVVMDVKSGEVLAYVGNVYDPADRSEGTSVDVVRAPRSSGSVLKPLLYAAMLDNGTALPTMLFPDVPTYYKDFTPQNFNHDFSGAVPANRVIERSLNVPSVKMLDKYGRENFLALVRNLGFGTIDRSADHYGLSLILGGAEITLWDLTSVYAMLAAKLGGGPVRIPHCDPEAVKTVSADDIPLSRGAIWLMFNSISHVARPEEEGEWQYFSSSKKIGWKTGTSYGNRDAWAVGATPDYAVGVWVGNCSGEGRPLMTGVGYAARRGVVRGASRRSGSGRRLPAERLSGFAHMSRPRYADDSPHGCRRRSLSLPPDRESEPRPPLPGDRGLLRPGADRPDADVYPAARAGVVLQEAASRLPSAAAFASGTFGQRGGRQSDRHRLSPAGARAGGAQIARRRGAESGLHGHTPRPQRRVILAYRRQLYRRDDPRTQDIRPSRSRCAPADRYRRTRGAAKRLVQLPLTAACGFLRVRRGFALGAAQCFPGGAEAGLPGGGLSRMGVFGGTGLFRSFGTGFSGLSSFL